MGRLERNVVLSSRLSAPFSGGNVLREVPIFRKGQLIGSARTVAKVPRKSLTVKEMAAIQMLREQCSESGKLLPKENAAMNKGKGWLEEWKLRHGPLARLPHNETLKRLFVTTNSQKHGGFLANCLVQNMADHGLAASVASTHASGGFLPQETQLNIARDPFLLVDAGYLLHARKLDKWSRLPIDQLIAQTQEREKTNNFRQHFFPQDQTSNERSSSSLSLAFSKQQRDAELTEEARAAIIAYQTLRDGGCTIDTAYLHGNTSYGDAVFSAPPAFGLLLEAVRALYRDIPYLVAAATDCHRVDQLRRGSCRTLLYDDVQRYAGLEAFVHYLDQHLLSNFIDDVLNETSWPRDDAQARAFFVNSFNIDVQAHCGVGGANSRAQIRKLLSEPTQRTPCGTLASPSNKRGLGCGARPERIRLLKQIDVLFLNRALHRANVTLYRLSAKLDPNLKHPHSSLLIPPSQRKKMKKRFLHGTIIKK